MKVKETLNQLKTTKNKEVGELKKHVVEAPVKLKRDNYDRKLYKIGLDKVFALI